MPGGPRGGNPGIIPGGIPGIPGGIPGGPRGGKPGAMPGGMPGAHIPGIPGGIPMPPAGGGRGTPRPPTNQTTSQCEQENKLAQIGSRNEAEGNGKKGANTIVWVEFAY